MKLQLHNQISRMFRLALICSLAFWTASASAAAMSGSFTIDNTSAASATNFQNWYSLSRALQGLTRTVSGGDNGPDFSGGISSAVTITVKSSLTESNQFYLPAISGTSSTNTITIDGNSQYLAFAGSYEVINLNGVDYLTIKNLTIRYSANNTSGGGIRFSNASDYNTIDKCNIEFSALTSGSTGNSFYIAFCYTQGSPTSYTSSSTGSYNTIQNCNMRTTVSGSPGPAYAIVTNGNSSNYSSTPTNNTIQNNKITNFYYMGIYNQYTNGNQFLNNDFSRTDAGSTSMYSYPYLTYSYSTYGSNRATKFESNSFHDLPYAGVSASSSSLYYFYNYMYYNYGNSTNFFSFSNNTFKNIMNYYYCYGVYGYYNYQANFNGNMFDNIQTYASGYSSYIMYLQYGNDINCSGNTVQNCSFGYYAYLFYMYNPTNSVTSYMLFEDNLIQNNYAGYYFYAAQIYYYGSWKINRNRIIKNTTPSYQGYFYGLYLYYLNNLICNSNVIADNMGYYGTYNMYTYSFSSGYPTLELRQNTIRAVGSGYSYHYNYGLLSQFYYNNDVHVAGNVVDLENSYYTYGCWLYTSSASNLIEVDNNTYWLPNNSYLNFQYYNIQSQSYTAWAASGPGPGENYHYPEYMNLSSLDYRCKEYSCQNTAPTKVSNPTDAVKKTRNAVWSDRGGLELAMDIKAEGSNFSVPAKVCQGYSTSGATKLYIRSNYLYDTAYKIKVAYSVNGGPKQTALSSKKILYNQLDTVSFNVQLVLNNIGTNKVRLFVDNGDDDPTNDTLTFTTIVNPAPGGEKMSYSSKATKALYQYGKPYDVTIVGQPVIYNFTAPKTVYLTGYNNGNYNSAWKASAWATTITGRSLPASEITTNLPVSGSLSSDMEVQYKTADYGLEDSFVYVYLKVSEIGNNNCDTTLRRMVRIYPSITPKFSFPSKICDGDVVGFTNLSNVKSGSMEFHWDFGTGKAADTSNAPDPVFVFPTSGSYKVKMTAKTQPFGFAFSDSQTVVVSPIPTVKFTKVNACEGNAVKFTSQVSPANATLDWDFGNGSTHSSASNPSYVYPVTGAYTVVLKATLNGCSATATQKAYEFDKPKASWTLVSGTCDNTEFNFKNTSTIKAGLAGAYWNFNDGNVSTEDETGHMFASPGNKSVKLIATSEFGCKDSLSKTIVVKESPKVSFTHTPACSLDPTTFTDLTPAVSGATANYGWDFGDGTTSSTESPVHNWTVLGPKTVMLTVTLDNGCKSSISKDLTVGIQPKAKFSATNVCSGDPVVFENGTTWSQGDISYLWNFGDVTTSTNSDPQHNYGKVSKTTTFFVTLYATVKDGCSDSLTKAVTVNESPKTCEFKADPDYAFGFHGMKFTPLDGTGTPGATNGTTYTWVVKGGGSLNGGTPSYDFQTDGEYEVTMRAHNDATGCECTITKKVIMNRTAAKSLSTIGIGMYPNPATNSFNVAMTESFGKNVTVQIFSAAGALVKTMTAANNGLLVVDASDLSNGVYSVRVSSELKTAASQIQIQK